MNYIFLIINFLIIFLHLNKKNSIYCVQLTFELPDNEVQCFYEHIVKGVQSVVEFQVVTGGNYDVDMILKTPTQRILYQDQKKQYDSFRFNADQDGEYEVCFSNEFSTFTHKLVFIDWQVGNEQPLLGASQPLHAMTLMETSVQTMHDKMSQVEDDQKHYQIRESQGRSHAEDLNERVQLWSIMQLGVIFVVGILQVSLIRSFFSHRR